MKFFTNFFIVFALLLGSAEGQVWSVRINGHLVSEPAVASASVIQTTTQGVVAAVSQTTGTILWKDQPTTSALHAAQLIEASDLVILSSSDGNIYAQRISSGLPAWTYASNGPIFGAVAIGPTRIYGGNASGDLFALDHGGKELWRVNAGGAILGQPAYAGSTVYLYVGGTSLQAFSAVDGKRVWAAPATHFGAAFSPLVVGSLVCITRNGGLLSSYNAATGKHVWDASLTDLASGGISTDGTRLYVGTADGNVSAFNASDGTLVWRTLVDDFISSRPSIDQGKLYVGSTDGSVTTLDTATGAIVSRLTVNAPVVATAVHQGSYTFVAVSTGLLEAFN